MSFRVEQEMARIVSGINLLADKLAMVLQGQEKLAAEVTNACRQQSPIRRAMHAAAEGRSTLGIPASVGRDFVTASHGESVKRLPQRVKKRKASPDRVRQALAGGRISEAQARKMMEQ